jgi:hypothetical protein
LLFSSSIQAGVMGRGVVIVIVTDSSDDEHGNDVHNIIEDSGCWENFGRD